MSASPILNALRSRSVSRLTAIAAALVLGAPLHHAGAGTTASSDWTLDQLMSILAQKKAGHARFVEDKYLAIADKPVESSGELVFAAPDHLEKITVTPTPERLVVDGDKLTIERNRHSSTLALVQYPELAAFIESIRGTLTGNRYVLEQAYKVALSGDGDDWALTLTPLDSRMAKVVQTITIEGKRDLLRSVMIQQADGDRSVMRIQNVSNE